MLKSACIYLCVRTWVRGNGKMEHGRKFDMGILTWVKSKCVAGRLAV